MKIPVLPKIYHIVHVDRLASIVADGFIWCDKEALRRGLIGSSIGMNRIKQRRLYELTLNSHPDLKVGDCVPFYFCPRSVMLYVISQANHPDLEYRGGQGPIIHIQADLHTVVNWANHNQRRWAFTRSNAGSRFFEDRNDVSRLDEIDWAAVGAQDWQKCKEGKQAEFLLEYSFPWALVEFIGVHSHAIARLAANALTANGHRPAIQVCSNWYY